MPRSLPPDQALAVVLRRLREERDISRESLAFESGISTGALARIELGLASPSWVTVRHVIGALAVSLTELSTEVEAESNASESDRWLANPRPIGNPDPRRLG